MRSKLKLIIDSVGSGWRVSVLAKKEKPETSHNRTATKTNHTINESEKEAKTKKLWICQPRQTTLGLVRDFVLIRDLIQMNVIYYWSLWERFIPFSSDCCCEQIQMMMRFLLMFKELVGSATNNIYRHAFLNRVYVYTLIHWWNNGCECDKSL